MPQCWHVSSWQSRHWLFGKLWPWAHKDAALFFSCLPLLTSILIEMLFLALVVLFLLSANNVRERKVCDNLGRLYRKRFWWLLLLLWAFGKILEMMFGGLVKGIITMVTAADMVQESLSLLFPFLFLCWHEIMWPYCRDGGISMSVIFVMQCKKRERNKHIKIYIFRI